MMIFTTVLVLNVVDVKVSYDQFKKGVVASASSKSIFILNPGKCGFYSNS